MTCKIVPEITYNVLSGTLSLYTTTTTRLLCMQALRAKVAEGGRVVSSESMDRMIDVAVEKVTKSCYDTEDDVDENIKEHITGVTQEFVDKVIEQIFAEMNADK